jgi:hypothetical protein
LRNQGLQHMLREDLDAAIALPPRDEWRPGRARFVSRGRWPFVLAVAALLLVVVVVVAGQLATRSDQQRQTPASPPVPTPAAGTVHLTIKSATTGQPIRGAVVSAYYDEPSCCHFYPRLGMESNWPVRGLTMSDAAGAYDVTLANGRYKLYIWVPLSIRLGDPRDQGFGPSGLGPARAVEQAQGFHQTMTAYAPQWLGGGTDYQAARVIEIAGKDMSGTEINMAQGHVISGTISNLRGKGVATIVDVFAGDGAQCCMWVNAAASQFTNEDDTCLKFPVQYGATQPGVPCPDTTGKYRIAVANGVYRLRVTDPASTPADPRPFRWWSDAQDFDHGRDIVVQDADVTGVDILVPLDY